MSISNFSRKAPPTASAFNQLEKAKAEKRQKDKGKKNAIDVFPFVFHNDKIEGEGKMYLLYLYVLTNLFICSFVFSFGTPVIPKKYSSAIKMFFVPPVGGHIAMAERASASRRILGGRFITFSDSLSLLMYSIQCFLGAHRKWP